MRIYGSGWLPLCVEMTIPFRKIEENFWFEDSLPKKNYIFILDNMEFWIFFVQMITKQIFTLVMKRSIVISLSYHQPNRVVIIIFQLKDN